MILPKEWADLVEGEDIKCLKLLGNETMPPRELVFRAFTYFNPNQCRVVILGQDPYPNGAEGLSFSNMGKKHSVNRIFKCLHKNNFIDAVPDNGNLEAWAERGVLLLNSMLTYSPKKDTFWFNFTDKLLLNLMIMNLDVVVFAWGEDAKKRTKYLPQNRVLSYAHPAAYISEWNFTGFGSAGDAFLKTGGWSQKRFLRIYTDGACTGNGKNSARGGWACVFHHGLSHTPFLRISGRLVETGLKLENHSLKQTDEKIAPTNNRGELYAIIIALMKARRLYGECFIEIISDSKLSINTASEWMYNWYPDFHLKKNPDLVGILYNVSQYHTITYTYQKAHIKIPKTLNELGNAEADRLASSAATNDDFRIISI